MIIISNKKAKLSIAKSIPKDCHVFKQTTNWQHIKSHFSIRRARHSISFMINEKCTWIFDYDVKRRVSTLEIVWLTWSELNRVDAYTGTANSRADVLMNCVDLGVRAYNAWKFSDAFVKARWTRARDPFIVDQLIAMQPVTILRCFLHIYDPLNHIPFGSNAWHDKNSISVSSFCCDYWNMSQRSMKYEQCEMLIWGKLLWPCHNYITITFYTKYGPDVSKVVDTSPRGYRRRRYGDENIGSFSRFYFMNWLLSGQVQFII